jgi:hypothetical protein
MGTEHLAAKAIAALDAEWWKDATNSELDAMVALDDSMAGLVPYDKAKAVGLVIREKEQEVRQRIALRRKLGLSTLDCTARRRLFDSRWTRNAAGQIERAPDCTCLTTALIELGEKATKGEALTLSTEHHRALAQDLPAEAQAEGDGRSARGDNCGAPRANRSTGDAVSGARGASP